MIFQTFLLLNMSHTKSHTTAHTRPKLQTVCKIETATTAQNHTNKDHTYCTNRSL